MERLYYLDVLRIISIFAVVVIHSISSVFIDRTIGIPAWHIANVIDSFLRWCVPVFVMISGALLIKESTYTQTATFFKKRFSRILFPLIAWPIIYAVFYTVVSGRSVALGRAGEAFLAGHPLYGPHLYFLFLIAGLYFAAPLLSAYVSRVTGRQVVDTAVVIIFLTTAWTLLGSYIPTLATSHNMFTQGLPYIGYFLLGYSLKNIRIESPIIPATTFIIASTLIAHITFIGHTNIYYAYTTPLVVISSVSVFMLVQYAYPNLEKLLVSRKVELLRRVVDDLSRKSFGVYLVHLLVPIGLFHLLEYDDSRLSLALIEIPITLIISWLLVSLLLRIPYLRAVLG